MPGRTRRIVAELGARGFEASLEHGTVRDDGGRALLPAPVPPRGTTVVPVPVSAPGPPGTWHLEIDLVHEHVRWFGTPLALGVTVRAPRRIAVLEALERYHIDHRDETKPSPELTDD